MQVALVFAILVVNPEMLFLVWIVEPKAIVAHWPDVWIFCAMFFVDDHRSFIEGDFIAMLTTENNDVI